MALTFLAGSISSFSSFGAGKQASFNDVLPGRKSSHSLGGRERYMYAPNNAAATVIPKRVLEERKIIRHLVYSAGTEPTCF